MCDMGCNNINFIDSGGDNGTTIHWIGLAITMSTTRFRNICIALLVIFVSLF